MGHLSISKKVANYDYRIVDRGILTERPVSTRQFRRISDGRGMDVG
jgi:hypothetical protein